MVLKALAATREKGERGVLVFISDNPMEFVAFCGEVLPHKIIFFCGEQIWSKADVGEEFHSKVLYATVHVVLVNFCLPNFLQISKFLF